MKITADNLHAYDDIINLPHHQSARRAKMAKGDRAAQFAPFAALKGYDDMVNESARLNEYEQEFDNKFLNKIP